MSPARIGRLVRGLGFGLAGGGIFHALGLPLPWVMGAMFATILAGATGLRGEMPRSVRNGVIPTLGVTFGSAFDRDGFAYLPDMLLLVPMTFVYLSVIIGCGCLYFTWFARMDFSTAYFASVPGSFSEMLFEAEERKANLSDVAIVHSIRQVVGLSAITLVFRFTLDIDTTRLPTIKGDAPDLYGAAVLVLCGVLGFFGARAIRLPSAHLFGPLILSAAAHLSGLVSVAPPGWMVGLVQVFIGIFVGLRFEGVRFGQAWPLMGLATIWALILLGFALVAARIAVLAVGLPREAAFLAFAPGGAVEISVVALAAGVSLSIVTAIQLVRMSLTVLFVPLVFRLFPGQPPRR